MLAAAAGLAAWSPGTTAWAQAAEDSLAVLRERGQREGWTFTVGETSATGRPLEELCGLLVPEDWWVAAPFLRGQPPLGLPAAFDWRAQGGCPPVRNQGECGSCWAFSTVGPLECNVLIKDGVEVDLSEQWLLSCNREGYDCDGGFFAHDYHQWQTDSCGETGAVLEADFPYAAADLLCGCPYEHAYTIADWGFIGDGAGVPDTAAIKQAILSYGPVSAAVYVDPAFEAYTSGVFNAHATGTVNHGIVLVGWDDNQGAAGVWILRNSWGPGWGEDGYMLIEYGCSSVGYAACYVDYPGAGDPQIDVTPASIDFGSVAVGQELAATFTVKNVGGETLSGSASGLSPPFDFDGSSAYTLEPGESQTISVRFAPALPGTFDDTVSFSGGGGATAQVSGSGAGDGPADTCAAAPLADLGTFTGSNVGAGTSVSAPCGGTADAWWRYVATQVGLLTIDTCGSDFDTVLSVYDACGGAELACSDDYDECSGNEKASRVTLEVGAGASYLIRVAGAAAVGNIVLNIQDDSAAPPTFTIAGRVTDESGSGISGVTITGLPGTPVTDSSGHYSANVSLGFSGTATPSKSAHAFEPPSRSYADVTSDQLSEGYLGQPQTGSLQITLVPAEARSAGARWRVDGGDWHNSGQTESDLLIGQHAVSYEALPGWTAPADEQATIEHGQTTRLERTYTQQSYTLTAVTTPPGAATVSASPPPDASGRYVHDTLVNLTATPQPGYRIRNWSGADDEPAAGSQTNTVTMTTDRNVVVRLEVEPLYQLEVLVVDGQGSVQPGRAAYPIGEVVTLSASPAAGYAVKAWAGTDDDTSTAAINTVTISGHQTVTVAFEAWQDCNGDGVDDRDNIAAGTSADCNSNDVPDECEPDGDGDGLIDDCDDHDEPGDLNNPGNIGSPMPMPGLCGFGVVEMLALTLVGLGFLRPGEHRHLAGKSASCR